MLIALVAFRPSFSKMSSAFFFTSGSVRARIIAARSILFLLYPERDTIYCPEGSDATGHSISSGQIPRSLLRDPKSLASEGLVGERSDAVSEAEPPNHSPSSLIPAPAMEPPAAACPPPTPCAGMLRGGQKASTPRT